MPIYRKIRELVDAGEIGNVQCTIAQYGASSALWGLTHAADMLLFLAGDPEVDFVQGTVVCNDSDWDGNRLNTDPAITSGYIRYANASTAIIRRVPDPEYEVCGTGGKIRVQKQQQRNPNSEKRMAPSTKKSRSQRTSRATGTVMGITDVAEAIDEDRETKGPIQLARRSQETLMGIIESHRLDGKRVSLPMENRGLYVAGKSW